MTKRVCILRSNPVTPDPRVEKEASALCEAGYSVDLFCWDRESNHPVRKEYHEQLHIPAYRKGCKAAYGAGLKSLIPFLRFQLSMASWIIRHGYEYDVFHACDFDTALFSYIPARLHKAKFVFDIFDFLCGDPHNLFQKIIKKLQLWLIDAADLVVICTEQRLSQISGTSPQRLIVIHNTPAGYTPSGSFADNADQSRISIVYVGILQEHRLLREMTEFFISRPQFDFYVAGFGQLEEFFINASRHQANIHFLGKISYSATLRLEEQCDIMTAIYDPAIENHKYAAPNKFYEAMMLGKPLLMVKGTGMSDIVERYDFGAIIDYSAQGFETGIKTLLAKRMHWNETAVQMKKMYYERFHWNVMKKRLTNSYKDIIGV